MKRRIGFWLRLLGLAAPMLVLLMPLNAHAVLTISSCTLSAPAGMVFNTNLVTGLTTTTSFTVSCTTSGSGNATYTIGLSAGSSGNVAQRKLQNGSNVLTYNLYQDSSFSTLWGATSNLNMQQTHSSFTNLPFTIYGKIDNSAANLAAPPGIYTDPSITVTISW